MKYYVLTIYDGTDPALTDPFDAESERNEEAVTLYGETDPDEDAVFCLDVDDDGEVEIYRFVPEGDEDEGDEEEEEERGDYKE